MTRAPLRRARGLPAQRRLRGGEASDRDAERGARDVVETRCSQKAIEAWSPPCSPQTPSLRSGRVARRAAAIVTSSPTPSQPLSRLGRRPGFDHCQARRQRFEAVAGGHRNLISADAIEPDRDTSGAANHRRRRYRDISGRGLDLRRCRPASRWMRWSPRCATWLCSAPEKKG
jgi:hypothetical protein